MVILSDEELKARKSAYNKKYKAKKRAENPELYKAKQRESARKRRAENKEKYQKIARDYMRKTYAAKSEDRLSRRTKYLKAQKLKYKELLAGKCCANCGFDNIYALQYHHMNPEEKVNDVSTMIKDFWGEQQIREEIRKCIILCANCHFQITNSVEGKSRKTNLYLWYLDYKKTLSCLRCGFSATRSLHFHHRDPSTKVDGVSHFAAHHGLNRLPELLEEIGKCDVLCANCHLIVHAEER